MAEFGASSVAGPRPSNEDGYLTIDLTSHAERLGGLRALLVVTDGMGGHASGELASRTAIEAAQEYAERLVAEVVADPQLEIEPFDALWEMIGEANTAVLRVSREAGGANMGTTIVGVLVGRDRAWVAHVGDSRVYHLRSKLIRQVTTDHSRVARMVAEGALTKEQAEHHPLRNVVERALGFEGALPDFGKVWLQPDDALVLVTDGLFTVLSPGDLLTVAASAESVESAALRLTEAAVGAGTEDNTTAVIWAGDWQAFRAGAHGVLAPETGDPARAGRHGSLRSRLRSRAQQISLLAFAVVIVAAGILVYVATRSETAETKQVVVVVNKAALWSPRREEQGDPNATVSAWARRGATLWVTDGGESSDGKRWYLVHIGASNRIDVTPVTGPFENLPSELYINVQNTKPVPR
jgi:PPM family protein phosphatase